MKKRTPKSIAADLLKARLKVMKAHEAMTSAEHYLAYSMETYRELPARVIEAIAELRTLTDATAQATAELTKPLDAYAFEGNYRHGRENAPRKYSHPGAQAAWNAQRAEERAREYLERLESDARRALDDYTAADRERLEYAQAEYKSACDLRDNLAILFSNVTGHAPTFEECETLTAKAAPKETPEMIEVTARIMDTGYVVMADNLAAALKGFAEFQIDGIIYYAKQMFEWAKLETGQITLTLDHKYGAIVLKSDTARATFKSQGDSRPAPALTFTSI